MGYVIMESITSILAHYCWWGESYRFSEDNGRTAHFDPITGFRLSRTPSREMLVDEGRVRYVTSYRGNCQGFPDRDDFGPKRDLAPKKRIALLGDSFTAGMSLGQNWADRVEDLVRQRGEEVQILNFSLPGAGLVHCYAQDFLV